MKLLALLLVLAGCANDGPDLRYGDTVVVQAGFYAGCTGLVIDDSKWLWKNRSCTIRSPECSLFYVDCADLRVVE